MRISTIRKVNRFNWLIQEACKLEKEAAEIAARFFEKGDIARLVSAETSTKLAGHHKTLSDLYRLAASRNFVCDCCHGNTRREHIVIKKLRPSS